MLTLGIPSNPVMALMIGAMIIQGIQPGPAVMSEQPALFWGLIVSMWFGNLFLVVLNLPLAGVWVRLLAIGVETGQMMTMDDLDPEAYRRAMAHRDDRHWVYHRAGLPCRVCGTAIVLEEMAARKLYWCPRCQA